MKSQTSTNNTHMLISKNLLFSKSVAKKLFIASFFLFFLFSPLIKMQQAYASCYPFGIELPVGNTMPVYNTNIVSYPDSCAAHYTSFYCNVGDVLDGWYAGPSWSQTCSVTPPTVNSISFSPSTILTGESSTGSFSSTGAETCTGSGYFWNGGLGTSNSAGTGVMSSVGTYSQNVSCSNPGGSTGWYNATLTVNGHDCTGTPWGTVAHGYSNTAYTASTADNCSAISQVRSCNDGSMSGSYTFTSCTNKQTTLTTGTDPSSTTISPDYGYGTNVNTFTFQTNVVTDTITALVINLTNASATSLVEITDNAGNGVLGSISNPSASSTHSITLTTPITANTSLTSYKIRIWPKSHANLPKGSLGMLYPVTAKVLSWTGTNSTKLGSDTATAVVTIDNEMQSTTGGAGVTWATSTSAANNDWKSVAYGNGLFVAVSQDGTGNRVMTSPDGITWTSRTSAANNSWQSITYGNGLFVAVAYDGSGNRVMTSPDGITWTSRTSAANNDWYSVTYGKGLFVAVSGSGAGNRVMTSPDGITWTSRTSAADNTWKSVTYGNGLFVAVANSGTGNRVMTSSDGITWTIRTSAADDYWNSVTYGNGLFVAVAYFGSGSRVMSSPDGITWTSRTSAANNGWHSVTYGNGLFVAVSFDGTGNRVMTSPNGITWTIRSSAVDSTWRSVAYGNGLFVSVASSGTGDRVMRSTSTIPTFSSVGANQVTINYTNPGDSDTHSILVLHATSTITDIPVDGTTYATGTSIGAATVGCVDTTIATSTADSCTVNNLSGNTSYYFSLFTKDNYGNYSKVFLPSPVSTTTLVSNPSNVSVISGDRKATIVYTTPSDSNQQGIVILQGTSTISQTPVDGVSYTSGTALGTSTFVCVNPDVGASTISSCDITGLTNGTTYHFKIFTKSVANKYSVGVVPTNSPVTPRVPAVTGASALTGNGKAIISYVTSPSTNQGGIILLKSTSTITVTPTDGVVYSVGNSLSESQVACVDSIATPNTPSACDVTGLSNGTPYYFAVFARSSIDGAYSASSSPSGSPVTPGIVTVLGSGTDPVSVTIAPPLEATSPTFVDSFTLQSGAGTDVVSSMVVALTNASSTSQIQITNDTGSIVYGTTANPTGATTSIALSTNTLTSNTTLTQYKIRITPKDQSGLPAQALGAIYAVTARVESFVSSLPHAGSDSSSATVSIDNLSPSEVTSDVLVSGNGTITVNYTTPSDSDYSSILVLRNTSVITGIPVDSLSYVGGALIGGSQVGCVDTQAVPGAVSSCQITGLTNGVPYYIKIFTKDVYGNWSGGSGPPEAVIPVVLTTSVSVDSYRLRNDDGTETTATYSSPENTGNSSTFVVGDKTRIRFAISNQTATQTTKSYSLEYSTGVCSVWTSVPRKIDATTQHWKMEPSSFVPDNAATTHSNGITESPGSIFTPGRIQTFNRTTQPITLLSGKYTEVEFSIRSTGHLENDTNYCFRLTNQGENSDFIYSQSLQITPMSRYFRYYGGGGGGGGLITIENATVLATTTYVGGAASSTSATSTNLGETSTGTTTTSTTTPRRGGGGGDVGFLMDLRNNLAQSAPQGLVLGDAFTPMCSDMKQRMLFGSTDKSTNGEVSQLQYYLSERGYFTGKITGVYLEKTRKAVEEFQKDNNLIVTGISGKVTRAKMRDISCVR